MGKSRKEAEELLLEYFGDGEEDKVEKLLDEANLRERQIEEDGLIARENETDNKENVEDETDVEDNTETEDEEDIDVVIDDDVIEQMVKDVSERVVAIIKPEFDKFEEFKTSIKEDMEVFRTFIERANKVFKEAEERESKVEKRLANVEKEDREKVNDALNDLSHASKRRVNVSYRPTNKKDDEEEAGKDKKPSLRDVSKDTISNLNVSERNK